jgi:hypothetical protein
MLAQVERGLSSHNTRTVQPPAVATIYNLQFGSQLLVIKLNARGEWRVLDGGGYDSRFNRC